MGKLKIALHRKFPTFFIKELKDYKVRENFPLSLVEKIVKEISSEELVKIFKEYRVQINLEWGYSFQNLLYDRNIVDYAISCSIQNVSYIPEEMISDENISFIEEKVKKYGYAILPICLTHKKFLQSQIIMEAYLDNLQENKSLSTFISLLKIIYEEENSILYRVIDVGRKEGLFKTIEKEYMYILENSLLLKEYLKANINILESIPSEKLNEAIEIVCEEIRKGNICFKKEHEKNCPSDETYKRLSIPQVLEALIETGNLLEDNLTGFKFNLEEMPDKCVKIIFEQFKNIFSFKYCSYFILNFSSKKLLDLAIESKAYKLCLNFDNSAFDESILNVLDLKFEQDKGDSYFIDFYAKLAIYYKNYNSFKNIIEILKERGYFLFNFHKEVYKNEWCLKVFIENNLYEYIDNFKETTFNEENINLLYRKIPFENFVQLNFIKSNFENILNVININTIDEFDEMFSNLSKFYSPVNSFIVMRKYKESGLSSPKSDLLYQYFLDKFITEYGNMYNDRNMAELLANRILNGERSPFSLCFIKKAYEKKEMICATCFNDILSIESYNYIACLPREVINKVNKKHINEIIKLLKSHNVSEKNIFKLAFNIYLSIGLSRARDLLSLNIEKSYGPISEEKLLKIFEAISPIDILFKKVGNGYEPVLNEEWIKLIFGENYKIKNTPIRNFLNDLSDKKEEIELLKDKINKDLTLSEDERKSRLQRLDNLFEKYKKELYYFFGKMSRVHREWDIIEEEFLKACNKSKLKIKLNISKINEILDLVETKRRTQKLEPRDMPLIQSDVFKYVGYDTQFTTNPEQAPQRAITLSRRMEGLYTKKFPDITLKKEGFTLHVYNPQDRRILSAGYRSGCCFRPNGNADDGGKDISSLVNYCCSTEYGGGIEITDENGNTVMFSPLLRNGNVLMIHSLETKNIQNSKLVHELLKEFAEKTIEESYKVGDKIDFVTITSLHNAIDTSYTLGQLPDDKKFRIFYDGEKFNGVYNNLDFSHLVLAHRDGVQAEDIEYGRVEHSYQYPINRSIIYISLNEEELKNIKNLDELNNQIISISNERINALKEGNGEKSYELLRIIKSLKAEYLSSYKALLSHHKNNDIYSDYKQALVYVNSINNNLGISIDEDIKEINCDLDWYIVITTSGKIIANCLPSGAKELYRNLVNFKSIRNLNELQNKDYLEENLHIKL